MVVQNREMLPSLPVPQCYFSRRQAFILTQQICIVCYLLLLSSVRDVLSHSVIPDSLRPHGRQPASLLCPWNFPGKSTGVGCYSLPQGILPLNLGMEPASLASPALAGRFFTTRTTWEALILGVKGLKLIHYEEQARWSDFMGSIPMRNVIFFQIGRRELKG